MKRSIPILLYHHVSPDREITPEGFERQLRWLLDQGYKSLSVSELLPALAGESASEQPSFVVTFDDGYLDNWTHVFPILQKLSVKAMMYLVTDRVENHAVAREPKDARDTRSREREPGGFLSWGEARTMASSGLVEFGSHTRSHRNFVRKLPYDNLEKELQISKNLIEKELGRPCEHLAWPWGDYEAEWLPLVSQTGYCSAMTTEAGANALGASPLTLKRLKVSREDVGWLSGRIRWNSYVLGAESFRWVYGWDRRLKTWLQAESPYSHG